MLTPSTRPMRLADLERHARAAEQARRYEAGGWAGVCIDAVPELVGEVVRLRQLAERHGIDPETGEARETDGLAMKGAAA